MSILYIQGHGWQGTYVSGTKGSPAAKMKAGMSWMRMDTLQPQNSPCVVDQKDMAHPTLKSLINPDCSIYLLRHELTISQQPCQR